MARSPDPKVAEMVNMFHAILASVPTEVDRDRCGPLTHDEIPQAAEYMRQLGAEVKAERERGKPPGAV